MKSVAVIVGSGLILHLVCVAGLLWSGGMIMGAFDGGGSASPAAALLMGLVRVVWWLAFLIPETPSGWGAHVLGVLSASVWTGLFYLSLVMIRRQATAAWRSGDGVS